MTKTLPFRLRLYISLIAVVVVAGISGMIIFENRTPLDAFYFVVVTISTVGFGDIHPVTEAGKLLTIGIIIFGVGCFVGLAASALDLMIENREHSVRLQNLNLLVGVFFSEVGNNLIRRFAVQDPASGQALPFLLVSSQWTDGDFTRASASMKQHISMLDSRTLDLPDLKEFLGNHKGVLLTLFENPRIIEHEGFTPLLQAVFHLAEELAARDQLADLPASDYAHLSVDINRVYGLLVQEWLTYMRHLKVHYPYLFSLAVRTNPFDAHASAVVRE
ncbi:potassium channel family protein [Methanoregula sp.]|uniref:potassium channel family protein n=1 Tax=Methanoregula sp. TaxID=2052170 RepID=UPI002CE3F73E|nr:potassium channel family protein [Methanoregula sp.]HVP96689.1 potassium channel family protein [Methanoregula sp.]